MGAAKSTPQVGTDSHEKCDDNGSTGSFCRVPSSAAAAHQDKTYRSPVKQSGASPTRRNCTTSSTITRSTFASYECEDSHQSPIISRKYSEDCWGGLVLESILSLVSPRKKNAISFNESIVDFKSSSNANIQGCQSQIDSSDKESWASPTRVQDFPLPSVPPSEQLRQLRPPLISEQHQDDSGVLVQDSRPSETAFPRERLYCYDHQTPPDEHRHQDHAGVLQHFLSEASKNEAESNLDAAISSLEDFLHQLHSLNTSSFSREHSKATALHKIGVLHWMCGRYFFAEHLLFDTAHIYQCLLDESNNSVLHEPRVFSQLALETSHVFVSLGRVYLSKGEGDSAMHCYHECVKHLSYIYNSPCNSTATTPARVFAQACVGAGRVLASQGRLGSSLKRYARALKVQLGNHASDFVITIESISGLSVNDASVPLTELAETLSHIGRQHEQRNDSLAMACHAKALTFYRSVLDHDAVDIGHALNNIGHVHHRLRSFAEAEDAFKTAHQVYSLRLGKNHRNTAGALLSLGQLYATQGMHKKALATFKRVLRAESAVFGELLSVTFHSIAAIYEVTFRLEKALKYYQRELDVLISGLPSREINVARLLHHMSKIAMQAVDCKGEYLLLDQAAAWLEKARMIYYHSEENIEDHELRHLETSIGETRKRMKRKAHTHVDHHII